MKATNSLHSSVAAGRILWWNLWIIGVLISAFCMMGSALRDPHASNFYYKHNSNTVRYCGILAI